MVNKPFRYFDRELSWLSFNARVLQEARDERVPLFERLKFLGIYSSNLDEFFRVRVASLRSLLRLKKKALTKLGFDPARLLEQIHRVVTSQQEAFGRIFRNHIVPELAAQGIQLVDEQQLSAEQAQFVGDYFARHVQPHLAPLPLVPGEPPPFLRDRGLYLVAALRPLAEGMHLAAEAPHYALLPVPTPELDRFVWVPGEGRHRYVMFLDDVIRHGLPALFPEHHVEAAYAIKLSRDAELYLEDEYQGSLVERIKKGLGKRDTGLPCRFLYDLQAPYALVAFLKDQLGLAEEDLVPGGRYHNLHDLMRFPRFGMQHLSDVPLPPLPHPELEGAASLLDAVGARDRLLHVPYQSFDYVPRLLAEAAADPAVEEIWMTLYRIADESAVARALIEAQRQGKRVTTFVEAKARFDEAINLHWAEQMEAAGVRVLYSMPGIKVHAKLALVGRREGEALRYYAYLGTGNFNEKTARVYADTALLTADAALTAEVRRVFAYLAGEEAEPTFEHLLVAPFALRKGFNRLVEQEMAHARAGREAFMVLKMNSLEDPKMIARLYEASQAGVRIQLLVRGICCLVPGVDGLSERITARSIVDRFLEHARLYYFHNGGDEQLYLASADWMRRNLNRRVEVAFPVRDAALREELKTFLRLQLEDNTKARWIDARQRNTYVRNEAPPVRAQTAFYELLRDRARAGGLLAEEAPEAALAGAPEAQALEAGQK